MHIRRSFSDDQIRDIRQSPLAGRPLGEQYGVSHQSIINIQHRRSYKNVPEDPGGQCKNEYIRRDSLNFLQELPAGCCGTAVTSQPFRGTRITASQPGGWSEADEQEAENEHVNLQRKIIEECLRIMGPTGVVLYHCEYNVSIKRRINLRPEIFRELPPQQPIIWNHQLRRFIPGGHQLNRLPNNYGMIYVFSGQRWSIPEETQAKSMEWGDL